MWSSFKKLAELVAFLILGWRTGRDQPEWGPARVGSSWREEYYFERPDPPPKTQLKDITCDVIQRLFITNQAYFLHAVD